MSASDEDRRRFGIEYYAQPPMRELTPAVVLNGRELRGPTTEVTKRLYEKLRSGKMGYAIESLERFKQDFVVYGDVMFRATYDEDGYRVEVLPPYSRDEVRIPQKDIEAMKKSEPVENRHERRKNAKLARRKR